MIRIKQLADGTVYCSNLQGNSNYATPEELTLEVRNKFYTLRAADVGASITGVGRRVTENSYWIYDKPGDEMVEALRWDMRYGDLFEDSFFGPLRGKTALMAIVDDIHEDDRYGINTGSEGESHSKESD